MDAIVKVIEEAIGDVGEKAIEVYRGTVSDELRGAFKAMHEERKAAQARLEEQHDVNWANVYAELGLDKDGRYSIQRLTGQVFEKVPVDKLTAPEGGDQQ